MNPLPALLWLDEPVLWAALAVLAAGFLLFHDRGHHGVWFAIAPLAVVTPLAAMVALSDRADPAWAALAACLVAAILTRTPQDGLQSECAMKLVWVLGGSLALSWAGLALMVLATGTGVVGEQWGVLRLGLDPPQLWGAALSLSLVAGLVFLGGAPFHFWAADLFQGAEGWLAPVAVAALQVSGAGWLMRRLSGISAFPDGARLTAGVLEVASGVAFVVGAATLLWQKRPERRIGTLASLQGALLLACIAAERAGRYYVISAADTLGAWAPHLVLALTGAATLARFVPVSGERVSSPAVMFRRHPLSAAVGLYAFASLAGVPGTPGARVWLEVAQGLAGSGRMGLLLALTAAWLAAFAVALRQVREVFGIPATEPAPEQPVPWPARAALWVAGAGLGALGLAWLSG